MRYVSMFSGIEAASVAWHPLGWEPLAFAEVDAFPSAVLAHHYPSVPNVGDMTAHDWSAYRGRCDLVVGGPPCQAFSVAGLRNSLADARGNLSLSFAKAIDAIRPLWAVVENVPGWLSTDDNAFGCMLGALVGADDALRSPLERGRWPDAGMVAGPGARAAWRVLDAQYFGLAQRRRRVFIVVGFGERADPAAVLFERHSLQGHHPPRRETGPEVAALTANGVGTCGADDNQAQAGHLIAQAFGGNNQSGPIDVETAVNAHGGPHGRLDFESETFVAHAFDARQSDVVQYDDMTGPLDTDGHTIAVAFQGRGSNIDLGQDVTGTLGSNIDRASGGAPCVAFDTTQVTSKANRSNPKPGDPCHPLAAGAHAPAIVGSAVRRLTAVECSRLQGFPDDYLTQVPWRGRSPPPDGPMYKSLGNSFAVPVVRWIGRRIAMVESIAAQKEAAE